MLTAKVTSKGQVTIPKEVRDSLGVQAGEGISFEEKKRSILYQKILEKSPFDKWVGKLKTLKGQKTDAIVNDLRGS